VAENMTTHRSRRGRGGAQRPACTPSALRNGKDRLNSLSSLFDPAAGQWRPRGANELALGAASFNWQIVRLRRLRRGQLAAAAPRSCEVYWPERDQWHMMPNMAGLPLRRRGPWLWTTQLYALGGHNGLAIYDTVERLSPVRTASWRLWDLGNSWWTRCGARGSDVRKPGAAGHGVAALGDKIYVAGGYDGRLHFSQHGGSTTAQLLNERPTTACKNLSCRCRCTSEDFEGWGGGAAAHEAHEGALESACCRPALRTGRQLLGAACWRWAGSPQCPAGRRLHPGLAGGWQLVRIRRPIWRRMAALMLQDGIVTRPRLALVAGGVAGYWLAASSSCSFAVLSSIAVAFVAYALAGGWRYLRAAVLTFPRDFRAARCLLGTLGALRRMTRLRLGIVQLFVRETVAKQPEAVCFRYEDEVWTFRRVDEYSNRRTLLLETGHSPGQVVALFAESRPEFACLWLGMAKAGVVGSALINYNLRAQSWFTVCAPPRRLRWLFGAELAPAVKEVAASLAEMRLYRFGDGHGVEESLDGVNDFRQDAGGSFRSDGAGAAVSAGQHQGPAVLHLHF
uniref:Long-chain-fatty-acid--CoA ligase n=1 Tax=Macrostomum lignano TaxID=282301 RepID=A0A1I8FBP3_9PLAT